MPSLLVQHLKRADVMGEASNTVKAIIQLAVILIAMFMVVLILVVQQVYIDRLLE